MKLAVVGGGWAGLSAAVHAFREGHDVRVFESGTVLGGRARSIHAPTLDREIDNGQHIMLGAYSDTLALMRDLGLDTERQFTRLPLSLRSADDSLHLRALPGLPAPLHIAAGLLTAKGLSWGEKRAAVRAMNQLRRAGWQVPRGATVHEWLALTLQPARLQRLLWIPLCIATMNTPAELACAQLFAHVLRDSLGATSRDACDILIPRTTLTELWPSQVDALTRQHQSATARGSLEIVSSTTIRRLQYADTAGPAEPAQLLDGRRSTGSAGTPQASTATLSPGTRLTLDERPERYDAVLVCTNTPSASRLLAALPAVPGSDEFLDTLNSFQHAPIATLTLMLEQAVALPAPMLLLHEDRERGHYGQWLFQGQDPEQRLLHVVVSDAASLMSRDRDAVLASMLVQLREQLKGVQLSPVLRHALVVEKRATFLSVPGLKRPSNRTPWPGVFVAGDWTDTDYPAVLEGAVRSGRTAAMLAMG